ncbi:MAG: flagellar hook-associated protein FlgK [Litoreibacter sp.]
MSISSSLSNAVSGLTAAARGAEVISANVANANTDGYGRRDITLGTTTVGGGVRVEGVSRNVNTAAIADRRLSDAEVGSTSVALNFFESLEASMGLPGDSASLSSAISTLEQNLITATARPDNTANLSEIVATATQITNKINDVSETIQQARANADAEIASQVTQINTSLKLVEELNTDINYLSATNSDASSLVDQRQIEIDKISAFIPLQEISRDGNQVSLITQTGATLLDVKAATLIFTATPLITPDMTLSSGGVSGLSIEGAASQFGDAAKSIEGGALAANFALRDTITLDAQTQLDALSRNLIERFSGPTADSTLSLGQAGLFTDGGADFDALNELDVSSRMSVNAIVDLSQGGDPTKLRDGIASSAPRPVGDGSMFVTLRSALTDPQSPASGRFTINGGVSDIVNDALSQFGASLRDSEANHTYATARSTALKDIELQSGVSTDDELQKLLVIEQAYAANVRVIQAVDEMMQSILRI